MLEVQNRTAFRTALFPGLDKHVVEHVSVVLKATYHLQPGQREPVVADEQLPLTLVDEHNGEPGTSSIRLASDMGPAKPGTDVVLVGHAWAPRGEVQSLDVTLRAGPLHKVVRVFGDRHYRRIAGVLQRTSPETFAKMPLVYERAFGGRSSSPHEHEPRNPAGVGLDGAALPNLEDPACLITGADDRPSPAGFGFVAPDWMPRVGYAGTYNAAWREERCPLLPLDFDERYHHAAHPDLVAARPFRGGEPVSVTHVTPDGAPLAFRIPPEQFTVTLWMSGQASVWPMRLDTVLLLPDEERLVLCRRATIPCPRRFLAIDRVRVQEVAGS